MLLLVFGVFALAAAGAVAAFAGEVNNKGDTGTTTVQCLADDGSQPAGEPFESPEYATITVSPTTLWPPNEKMQTIGLSMSFTDDEPDTQSLTVLSITSNQGTSGDFSGVGNSVSGTADGSTISTSVQLRATRDDTDQAGRTYTLTLQCGEDSVTPGPQNTVTVEVTVPHDQDN
jgi:hypothetical protein